MHVERPQLPEVFSAASAAANVYRPHDRRPTLSSAASSAAHSALTSRTTSSHLSDAHPAAKFWIGAPGCWQCLSAASPAAYQIAETSLGLICFSATSAAANWAKALHVYQEILSAASPAANLVYRDAMREWHLSAASAAANTCLAVTLRLSFFSAPYPAANMLPLRPRDSCSNQPPIRRRTWTTGMSS